jgi:hypothetical protein
MELETGMAEAPEVFTLPHVIHVDSSGLQWTPVALLPGQIGWCNAQSTGLQSSPVQSSPLDYKPLLGVQSQSSGLRVQSESSGIQWSPVESSQSSAITYYLLILIMNTTKKAEI